MRRHLGWSLLLLVISLTACQGSKPPAKPPNESSRPGSKPAPGRLQAQQCRQTRETVNTELAALRQAERQLSQLKLETPPNPASDPPSWDEGREQRYSQQDQQLDRQRYQDQLDLWRQRQAAQQQSWRERQVAALADAQRQLNQRAAGLRRLRQDLFTEATSIEVNPSVLAQIQRCPDNN